MRAAYEGVMISPLSCFGDAAIEMPEDPIEFHRAAEPSGPQPGPGSSGRKFAPLSQFQKSQFDALAVAGAVPAKAPSDVMPSKWLTGMLS